MENYDENAIESFVIIYEISSFGWMKIEIYAIYVNDFLIREKHLIEIVDYWIDAYHTHIQTKEEEEKKNRMNIEHKRQLSRKPSDDDCYDVCVKSIYINGIKKALRRHSVDIITYTVRK